MLSQDSSKWIVCNKPECRNRNVIDALRTRFSASKWLFQFKNDPTRLTSMRGLIPPRLVLPGTKLSDQDLMDKLTDLLATGTLHVHAPEEEESGGGGAPPVEVAPPFPLSDRKQRVSSSSREAPPDPATWPDDCNLSQQAAVLANAAAEATAFCDI
jgi:hypothetical protein